MVAKSDMLFLLVSLLLWTQTEGGCTGALVGISLVELNDRKGFNLSCEFTCLTPTHVAQMWRDSSHGIVKDRVSLLNITSTLSNVMLVLSINPATKKDTGTYSCRTQPPDTISQDISIDIADELLMKSNSTVLHDSQTTPSTSSCDCSCQRSAAGGGLQSQIWYWILLGKTAILFLSLTALAVKYKKG